MILFEDSRYKVMKVQDKKGRNAFSTVEKTVVIDKTLGKPVDACDAPDYVRIEAGILP